MIPLIVFLLLVYLGLTACVGTGSSRESTVDRTPDESYPIFAHPRLLFIPDELPGLRERISGDRLRPVWEEVLADAGAFSDPACDRFVSPEWVAAVPGAWMRMHGRPIAERLERIVFAFQITGDKGNRRSARSCLAK